jgi:hypothetical protein
VPAAIVLDLSLPDELDAGADRSPVRHVSFTNATAFSPTDTMPLSQVAKVLTAGQALSSLLTIGLVVPRAVNILT